MPSKKRLQDLEYNVFKKNMDTDTPDNLIGTKDSGCLTMLAAVIVFVLVIVVIVGFVQVGRNGPALTCAAPGCSNRLKPGSNYCWLHSNPSNTRKSSGGYSSSGGSSSNGNGSVIGGSSSGSTPSRNKIWGGSGSSKSKSSSSSGASSGGSSSGGSSIGN